uniref:DNA primase n=1 Tax=Paulinella longichromatophora TaxID=1708747 RepID=A0A2H4ZNJ8_9EUKA|nr:DNA primase [Paulinella longichromatophora]
MNRQFLHQRTIEAVKERLNIIDVISDHVILKKRGREFVGICPFHDDKSPSMTVSQDKQFYHCFSCGAGGNAIKFLMALQGRSFQDVVLDLARKYQLPIDSMGKENQKKLQQQISNRQQLYRILALANKWFCQQLYEPIGSKTLIYLKKERKLNQEVINKFGLGYAPESWDSLLEYLHKTNDFTIESLEASGLIKPRNNSLGFCDMFRNRVMIPIRDQQGRTIAFGGRSLDESNPKYLNSPETEVFQKRKCLFGINMAYNSIQESDKAIVVEGYFDVIALYSAGITNVVASLGTTLNKQQITQLCHYTRNKRIVLNFDTDSAGTNAAERAINEVEALALKGQIELRILHISGAKDPDDFIKSHTFSQYQSLLDQAPLWFDWQINQILKDKDLHETEQFQQVIRALLPLLKKLSQPILRSHYLKKVAELLSSGQSRFALHLEEDLHRHIMNKNQYSPHALSYHNYSKQLKLQELAEEEILRIYIHCGSSRITIHQQLSQDKKCDFLVPAHSWIWTIIEQVTLDKELASLNLPKILPDIQAPENNLSFETKLVHLLNPSEVQLLALTQPLLQLRGAIAVIEKQNSLKRCRHLLDAWANQQLQTFEDCIRILMEQERYESPGPINMESKMESMFFMLNADKIRFQELYYKERKRISYLDMQRWTNLGIEVSPL